MVNTISADILARRQQVATEPAAAATAFVLFDTESIPDGRLLAQVKYPGENISPEDAIARAQAEARDQSRDGSDFLPVTFQIPISVCVARIAGDFSLQALACLDAPTFRPREIVRKFWLGISRYRAKLVTFNGRGFDIPLLELAAFRWGFPIRDHFLNSRNRFNGNHIDLCDWLTNHGACRLNGGLNLLAKLLGKPGKRDVAGDQVYQMHCSGRLAEINDYCLCDTLDTYFVFLRTRVLLGELQPSNEAALIRRTRVWLTAKAPEFPVLTSYLANWDDGSDPPERTEAAAEKMAQGADH